MRLKQDRMDSQERMEALFKYQKPDRVPLAWMDAGFSSINAGYPITTAYADPEKSFQAMLWAEEQYGFDSPPQIIRHTILAAHDFGGEVRLPTTEFETGMMVISPPVQSKEDALDLKMPDPRTAGGIPFGMSFSKIQAAQGLKVCFHHRSPFTMAANICDIERFAKWMYRRPDLCDRLVKMATDHIFNVLAYWIGEFGAENIYVYNSSPMESNQLISSKHFERFALPAHLEYLGRLKDMNIQSYFFHVCGDQNGNLPYLSEIAEWPHPAILSFGHEVDLKMASEYFPRDIIYGNIDTTIIQTGTPNEVYEFCRKVIEKGKKMEGGFILSPGCDLPVYAPPVNVFAMTRAINDFGWY